MTQQESLVSPIDRRSDYYRRAACEQCGNSIMVLAGESDAAAHAAAFAVAPATGTAAAPDETVVHRRETLLTAPNVLTLFRLALVPVFLALWFVDHGDAAWAPPAAAAVFAAAVRSFLFFFSFCLFFCVRFLCIFVFFSKLSCSKSRANL